MRFGSRYGNGQSADIPTKVLSGLQEKYFKTAGNRNWVFAAEDMEEIYSNGKPYGYITLSSV